MSSSSLYRRLDIEFKLQSQSIAFSEWLSLLTLCFAPLVAHLLVGVPEPTVCGRLPLPWHERICHFNPTSILWRYFAIADRRARAKKWDRPDDLGATNAIFWDGERWDGSVEKMVSMRGRATKEPPNHHISVFSTSAVGTLIITLQGIQAISDIIVNLTGSVHPNGHPISRVFFPLAILGLVRLPAAPWLTSEYGYRQRRESEPLGEGVSEPLLPLNTDTNPIAARSNVPSNQFYPQNSWRGISTRVILMAVLLVLIALRVEYFALDFESDTKTSLTTFASQLFYLNFLVCSLAIFASFIWRKEREEGNTTIIPCISSIWYQVYTYILFSLALVFILISALETRRTKCGLYTTDHIGWGRDDLICEAYLV
ncbi:hypothetical protein BGZ57DRAFT_943016 [Hyaloscypha finlandica]|nr:hypothetical protein BGZ57DRAFT_943016 [Hyaloscypha finlandica]